GRIALPAPDKNWVVYLPFGFIICRSCSWPQIYSSALCASKRSADCDSKSFVFSASLRLPPLYNGWCPTTTFQVSSLSFVLEVSVNHLFCFSWSCVATCGYFLGSFL